MAQQEAWKLAVLSQMRDAGRVLGFARKSNDYIELETGSQADPAWVDMFFNDAPPGRGAADIVLLGVEGKDEVLHGLVGLSPAYETQDEWYIGLLLLEPAWRGQGIGAELIQEISALAAQSNAKYLKCAVLEANPDGLRFWQREGFSPFRDGSAEEAGDGHARIVLQKAI